jgi:hypothetical protein
MVLKINHLSETGFRKIKVISNIKDITYDYGYEFPIGVVNPAVKIVHDVEKIYAILGTQNPSSLVKLLKKKVTENVEIELPCSTFDFGKPLHEVMLTYEFNVREILQAIQMRKFWRTDASSPFFGKEWDNLCKGNLYALERKNIAALSELWAATLPTPGKPLNVSKKDYFYVALSQFNALCNDPVNRLL